MMQPRQGPKEGLYGRRTQILFVSLELLLLVVLGLLAFSPNVPRVTFGAQTLVTGGLFILICAVGLVAAVAPGRLRGIGHEAKRSPGVVGHHPDCPEFSGHVLRVYGRVLCVGCTGLALGAVLSILGGAATLSCVMLGETATRVCHCLRSKQCCLAVENKHCFCEAVAHAFESFPESRKLIQLGATEHSTRT